MWQDYKNICRETFYAGRPVAAILVFFVTAVSVLVSLTSGGGVVGVFYVFVVSMTIVLIPTIVMCTLLTVVFFLYRLTEASDDSSR